MRRTKVLSLLFTDIEGSTRLLEAVGDDEYADLLAEHHRIIRSSLAQHGGRELGTEGDAFFAVFDDPGAATASALTAQLALARSGVLASRIRVRMGLHTGEVVEAGDNVIGQTVHLAARVCAAAHGGQVLATSAAAVGQGGARPDPQSWRPLGRHRLKDLGLPQALFELRHPGLAADNPPPRTLDRVTNNLPVVASSFLGRHDDLAVGAKLLAGTRLLCIIGAGGTGKTRIAYQLAADAAENHPDGVWVAELAAIGSDAEVPEVLARALGLRDQPGRTTTDVLVDHLSPHRALIVLDNAEHVLEGAAGLAVALLAGCPRVDVLVTSREPLRVAGETVWALPPMAVPADDHGSLAVLSGVDAVALFSQRAAEADASFSLTAENVGTVARICRRLEGIPLAVELAAARVRGLPLNELALRLEQSFGLLNRAARGTAPRQASLHGTIAWSHELLEPQEKVLFRRLGLFIGGWRLQIAEAVCAGEELPANDVLDFLTALVDRSLVILDRETGRYRMLETIRAFAAEQLAASGEERVLIDRYTGVFAALGARHGGNSAADAIAALDEEHGNLLMALALLNDDAVDDAAGRQAELVEELRTFWRVRGHWELARRQLEAVLARGGPDAAPEETLNRAAALRGLAGFDLDLGDLQAAGEHYGAALELARSLGDVGLEAQSLGGLANLSWRLGELGHATENASAGAVAAAAAHDLRTEAQCRNVVGIVATMTGDYLLARTSFELALNALRSMGDDRAAATVVVNLGNVSWALGDLDEARRRYLEGLEVARALGDRASEGMAVGNLGDIARHLGDHAEARVKYEESLQLAEATGDRFLQCFRIANLGAVALDAGDLERAQRLLTRALGLSRDMGAREHELTCLAFLAEVAVFTGRLDEARQTVLTGLSLDEEIGRGFVEVLESAAQVLVAFSCWAPAVTVLAAADRFVEASGERRARDRDARVTTARAACAAALGPVSARELEREGADLTWAEAAARVRAALATQA